MTMTDLNRAYTKHYEAVGRPDVVLLADVDYQEAVTALKRTGRYRINAVKDALFRSSVLLPDSQRQRAFGRIVRFE